MNIKVTQAGEIFRNKQLVGELSEEGTLELYDLGLDPELVEQELRTTLCAQAPLDLGRFAQAALTAGRSDDVLMQRDGWLERRTNALEDAKGSWEGPYFIEWPEFISPGTRHVRAVRDGSDEIFVFHRWETPEQCVAATRAQLREGARDRKAR